MDMTPDTPMDCPKVEMPAEIKQTFEKLFSHLDLSSIGGKNYTSKRTNMAWKGFQAGWNVREVPPDRPAQPAGGVGLWSGIKSLDDLRGKAARSGSGCIVVSINDLNKIRDELSYLTPSPAPTININGNQVPLQNHVACAAPVPAGVVERKFQIGERVTKIKGSKWTGKVVGFYSTDLTPVGYAVESETEIGSVQIYPEAALQAITRGV